MVRNLVISLNDDDLINVGFLKQHMGRDGDNKCELYFRMKDSMSGNYVMLRSKKSITVDKQLMDALNESGIKFKVNARI